MWNVHWVAIKECLFFSPQNRWKYIVRFMRCWLDLSGAITLMLHDVLKERTICTTPQPYPIVWIKANVTKKCSRKHLAKSNSMPAEQPSKLVTSGKQNIWSCNHNCVGKLLQVLAVILPLVFISVGNCSDVYILAHVLWWCDNKSDLIWFDYWYIFRILPKSSHR